MAGFNPNNIDEGNFMDGLDVDDIDIDKSAKSTKSLDDEDDSNEGEKVVRQKKSNGPKGIDKKQILTIVGGVLIFALMAGVMISNKISSNKALKEQAIADAEALAQAEKDAKENVDIGIPGLTGTGAPENEGTIVSPELILKDINGNQVNPNYTIVSNDTITDFINYTKYRTTTGDGLEFYWLEATYKDKPYKVQITYSVYSKLETTGITVVDMEVLTLDDDTKIITYMNVRKDAKNQLQR